MAWLLKSVCIVLSILIGLAAGLISSEESNKGLKRVLKILIYAPNGGYSHFGLKVRLAELLAERGHDVHMLMLNEWPPNAPKEHKYTIHSWSKFKDGRMVPRHREKENNNNIFERATRYIEKNVLEWPYSLEWHGAKNAKHVARDTDFMFPLRDMHFDVGICEVWYFGCIGVLHLLGIETTIYTTAQPLYPGISYFLGLPEPNYIPDMYSARAGDGLGMSKERKRENELEYWYTVGTYQRAFDKGTRDFDVIARELYGWTKPFPKLQDLFHRCSYMFVNTNRNLDFFRPVPPKVNYFGGITLKSDAHKTHELKEETEQLVEYAKGKRIILFSFGSIIDTNNITDVYLNAFLGAFSSFEDCVFLWKFQTENKELEERIKTEHKNIQILPWLQQKELLNLPQTKAFISHCGLNSVNEAIHFQVPLVCIPLFGDQPYNAAMVEYRKIGVYSELVTPMGEKLTAEKLRDALKKVLTVKEYKNNLIAIKNKLNQPGEDLGEMFVSRVEAAAEVRDENSETGIWKNTYNKRTYISAKPGPGISLTAPPPSATRREALDLADFLEEQDFQQEKFDDEVPSEAESPNQLK